MRCHFNVIGTCVCACVCVCKCVYACMSLCMCACACMCVHDIYGCHSSDDQSSCYCSQRSVNLSQGFAHRFVATLEDNPQATKCIYKRFTVKSREGTLHRRLYSHPRPGSKWGQAVKAKFWSWSSGQGRNRGQLKYGQSLSWRSVGVVDAR